MQLAQWVNIALATAEMFHKRFLGHAVNFGSEETPMGMDVPNPVTVSRANSSLSCSKSSRTTLLIHFGFPRRRARHHCDERDAL